MNCKNFFSKYLLLEAKVYSFKAYFEDEQSIIGVSLETALGDGVDMKVQFSQNDVDLASQATAFGGNDSTSDYFAEASMTVGF